MREHTGQSLAIALLATIGYTIWGALIAGLLWAAVTTYAIVKWIGAPNDHPSATTLLVVLVGVVTLFPLLLAIGFYLIGRSIRPKKRSKDEGDRALTEGGVLG
jgi:hypothetical protein